MAFAFHDRRVGARIVGVVAAGVAAAAAPAGVGVWMILAAALAVLGATAAMALRPLSPHGVAAPAIGGAAVGLGIGAVLGPTGIARWETELGRVATESAERAVAGYRAAGFEPASREALEAAIGAMATGLVELWPALVVLALWLGTWLGYRIFARWGAPTPPLAGRLDGPGFLRFRLGEAAPWLAIGGLAGLWAPQPTLERLSANALAVALALFGVQGLAVAAWVLARRGTGPGTRLALGAVAFLLLTPIAAAASVLAGLADHWLAFRERGVGGPDGGVEG